MAVIDINRPHTMKTDDVKDTAQHLVEKLEKEFGVKYSWSGNVVKFECAPKGVSGKLTVEDDSLGLYVKLGFLASMFEKSLRNEIDAYLNEHVS